MTPKTKVLHVNTAVAAGGAEVMCRGLHEALMKDLRCDSWLAVGWQGEQLEQMLWIDPAKDRPLWTRFWLRVAARMEGLPGLQTRFAYNVAFFDNWVRDILGRERLSIPACRELAELVPSRPDIVHCHNLHGRYFDLSALVHLQTGSEVLLTLHDLWWLTGHCGYPLSCPQWSVGCGSCPDLLRPPSIRRDSTRANRAYKEQILAKVRPYAAVPSQWVKDQVLCTAAAEWFREIRVVPNGIDIKVFNTQETNNTVRERLGISKDEFLLVASANGLDSNPYKAYSTLRNAVREASRVCRRRITLLAVGSGMSGRDPEVASIVHIPFVSSRAEMAAIYRASDLCLHGAKAETFGLTIIEAFACGLPVVASSVGGIPEIINDGVNGFLVKINTCQEFAEKILLLERNKNLRLEMAEEAKKSVFEKYTLELCAERYIEYYLEISDASRIRREDKEESKR